MDMAYTFVKKDSGVTVVNSKPANITTAAVHALNPIVGHDSVYKFEFTPANSLPE